MLYQLSYALGRPKRGRPARETQGLTQEDTMTPRLALLLRALAAGARRDAARRQNAEAGDDRWQIGLENGEYIWDIRLVRLQGDSLVFRQADTVGDRERAADRRAAADPEDHDADRRGRRGRRSDRRAHRRGRRGLRSCSTLDFPARLRAIQQIFLLHPPHAHHDPGPVTCIPARPHDSRAR